MYVPCCFAADQRGVFPPERPTIGRPLPLPKYCLRRGGQRIGAVEGADGRGWGG